MLLAPMVGTVIDWSGNSKAYLQRCLRAGPGSACNYLVGCLPGVQKTRRPEKLHRPQLIQRRLKQFLLQRLAAEGARTDSGELLEAG